MKAARQFTLFLLILLSLAAVYGSYHMITDPSGHSLGLPFYLLNGTIFTNYLVVGWILLFAVGLMGLLVILMLLTKSRYYSFFIMIEGVIVSVFVFLQWLLIGETFVIQFFFLIMGIALIGLGAIQNQRKIVVDTEKSFHPEPKSHHHKHRKNK